MVDMLDSKSGGFTAVRVQVPLWVKKCLYYKVTMKNNLEFAYPETPDSIQRAIIKLQENINSEGFPERFTKVDNLAQRTTDEILLAIQICPKTLTQPFTLK